jgi:uncharacterized flavoprotein (TIGR03862 family)
MARPEGKARVQEAEAVAALVVGAGPAGLMAAEALAATGLRVVVAEARPSPGRKFLMAGRSGLNLTKREGPETFRRAYAEAGAWLAPMLDAFGPDEVMAWAEGLGQPVFAGSTGRVFPVAMKASPLLRAWLARLAGQGGEVRRGWRWRAEAPGFAFDTPQGPRRLRPGVAVLGLGGASWARLDSDGAWAPGLAARGVALAPFRPANIGLAVDWPSGMAPLYGTPVKGVALTAGAMRGRGEFVLSARGLEGGGIYAVARAVREGAALTLDLCPDLAQAEVARRLAGARAKDSLANRLRKALRLDPARLALLRAFADGPLPAGPAALAALVKALPVRHAGPRPMDEAISTAGGITRDALDEGLMLRAWPGVFAAGEMLDWEAPTGGYLLTACLATGLHAGRAAAARAASGAAPPAD